MRMPVFSRHQPVLQQSERVFEQRQKIDGSELILLASGVSQKIGNDAVQPLRLPGHDLQQLAMLIAQVGNAGKHAHRAGNRSQRIADLVRDGGSQPAHGRQPVLNAQIPLQTPDFSQIIEGVDVAHRFPAGNRERGGHHPKSLAETVRRHKAHFAVGAFRIDAWATGQERAG